MINEIPISPQAKATVYLTYVLGAVLWIVILVTICRSIFIGGNWALKGCLLLPFPVFLVNVLLWRATGTVSEFNTEITRIEEVETHASYVIGAVLGTVVIAAALKGIDPQRPLPPGFANLQTGALIAAVGGVLPLYWIPNEKPAWLLILRHLKGLPLVYSIALFLGGIAALLSV